MSLPGVLRLGEVCVRVLDMAESRMHYGDHMGLIETGRDGDERSYYKGWDEHDCHSVVIQASDSAGIEHVAFKVIDDATLDELDVKLKDYGVATKHVAAGGLPAQWPPDQIRIANGAELPPLCL